MRAIPHHLLNKTTISSTLNPTAFVKLKEMSFTKCGFDLFFALIVVLSPHLGGNSIDLQIYVNTLKIHDGEPVLSYYLQAMTMSEEIRLQKDVTRQTNRLIYRFIVSLFQLSSFTECLRPLITELQYFLRVPNHHLQKFPRTLASIYQLLFINRCAHTTITKASDYKHTLPQQVQYFYIPLPENPIAQSSHPR